MRNGLVQVLGAVSVVLALAAWLSPLAVFVALPMAVLAWRHQRRRQALASGAILLALSATVLTRATINAASSAVEATRCEVGLTTLRDLQHRYKKTYGEFATRPEQLAFDFAQGERTYFLTASGADAGALARLGVGESGCSTCPPTMACRDGSRSPARWWRIAGDEDPVRSEAPNEPRDTADAQPNL